MSALWGRKEDSLPEKVSEGEQQMSSPLGKDAGGAPKAAGATSPTETQQKVNALLGKGSEFEGKLNFEGAVRIDGVMKGEIISKDKLIVGESAKVEAEINVGSAVISGEVIGNITAASEVELIAPAKVTGNIKTPSLIIQKGVIFDGNCSMSGKTASKAPSPSPAQESKKE